MFSIIYNVTEKYIRLPQTHDVVAEMSHVMDNAMKSNYWTDSSRCFIVLKKSYFYFFLSVFQQLRLNGLLRLQVRFRPDGNLKQRWDILAQLQDGLVMEIRCKQHWRFCYCAQGMHFNWYLCK